MIPIYISISSADSISRAYQFYLRFLPRINNLLTLKQPYISTGPSSKSPSIAAILLWLTFGTARISPVGRLLSVCSPAITLINLLDYEAKMKHVYESAIEKHYLQSVLPHPSYPVQKQVPKNKDFYRPEQFIWNNPHRASHQMYKFYHAYNDHYLQNKDIFIKQQEQSDRDNAEIQRIHRLIEFRNRTREEFFQKQKSRIRLEEKVHDSKSIPDKFDQTALEKSVRAERKTAKTDFNSLAVSSQYHPLTQILDDPVSQSNIVVEKNGHSLKSYKTHRAQPKSQRIIKIQEGYQEGLKKYDIKTQQVYRKIQAQSQEYHQKLRSQFLARKMTNDQTNSRLYQKVKKFTIQ